ncbi:hypothetical protein [Geobacter sp. FeAm09]|nr:hypothetical protein [Geobacter sp. FeAm09]
MNGDGTIQDRALFFAPAKERRRAGNVPPHPAARRISPATSGTGPGE